LQEELSLISSVLAEGTVKLLLSADDGVVVVDVVDVTAVYVRLWALFWEI
jgi:hypothetical protein